MYFLLISKQIIFKYFSHAWFLAEFFILFSNTKKDILLWKYMLYILKKIKKYIIIIYYLCYKDVYLIFLFL